MSPRLCYSNTSILLFLFLVIVVPAYAQDQKTPDPVTPPAPTQGRPRVGLAFAGGSALGEAHIGVLKWMEEHHVPIDYIAGTSMGGLVGGAYACGYSPDQLQDLLSTVDWQMALRGDVPYSALGFRRKEDARAIPNRFEFGIQHGLSLPGGLNPAHKIGLLLSEIAYPCSTVKSFDELPIPFRCVATDLQTGEAVVLKDGSLASALRATMALPALFTPVRRDGHLLSDGGIVNNLPTEAVRDMGATTIIAVDLNASGLKEKDTALQSLLSIAGRSVTLAIRGNEQVSLKIANIVIAPDLKDLTGNDFLKTEEFVKRGYAAAEAQKAKLLPLALSDADWQEYVAARVARRVSLPKEPAFLTVYGPQYGVAHRLAQELRPLLREPFPSKAADERLTLLTGGGRYNSVLYEAAKDDQGRTGLRIIAQQKGYGPPFLKAGLAIDGSDTKSVQVNAVTRYIGMDTGLSGAEERVDVSLGSNVQVSGEYYMPIGGSESRYFIAPRLFYTENNRNAYQNGTRTAVYGTEEFGGAFDVGTIPSRFSQVRFGIQESRFQSGLRTGTNLPTVNGNVQSLHLIGTWDRLDDGVIPHAGFRAIATGLRYLDTPGADTKFNTAEVRFSRFFPQSADFTVFTLMSGGTTFGKDAPGQLQFTLGGPFRLGSIGVDGLRGNDYYLLTAGVLRQFSAPPPFGGRTLIGLWAEYGGTSGATFEGADNGSHAALSGGVMTETFLGPVLLGVSVGDNGRGGLTTLPYFTLGRIF